MAIETRSVELISDASGDVSVAIDAHGLLRTVVSRPDTGSQQPTTLWDLTVTHEGIQIYQDLALSNSANTHAIPSKVGTTGTEEFLFPLSGPVTLTGANMGNAKRAIITIYLEQ